VAYSGAVAINNWLDLGASVLILWVRRIPCVHLLCLGCAPGMLRSLGARPLTLVHPQHATLWPSRGPWPSTTQQGTDAGAVFHLAVLSTPFCRSVLVCPRYGGYLVMAGRLSIGQLITFQLYWNLIQNGYQSVMSVLTSLTKASGAAQRVLSLVDALPDIDPNAGRP